MASATVSTTWRRPRLALPRIPWTVALSWAIIVIALIAITFPSVLTRADPYLANPLATLQPPSTEHWLGTDALGRDLWSRIVYGARYSLAIGVGATVLSLGLGAVLGVAAGIGPKWLDMAVARVTDVIASFPEILLALVLIAFTGPGFLNLIIALGIAGTPRYARLLRSELQVSRRSGYVEQAQTFGLSAPTLLTRHVLPNALGVIPVVAAIGLGGAIIGAASLSFIGMGPQPPIPEWGSMLAESRAYLRVAWWNAIFPGIALVAVIIASTVVGRYLQARHERRTR